MKKLSKLIACLLTAAITLTCTASLAGCAVGGNNIDIDEGKTQLYVGNYDGGYGHAWLDEMIKQFEAKYADRSFEQGKTGVQIIPENNKDLHGNNLDTIIRSKTNEVYFTETVDYYSYINQNLMYDITDIVTTPNAEDNNKTIESKLTDEQKSYYKTEDNKYYAVPHYAGFPGIQYNIDLFDSKQLYFAKNGAPSEALQDGGSFTAYRYTNLAGERSAGPDGTYDTVDDGLPATYEEFYKLMDEMVRRNVTPFVFTGQTLSYINWLLAALQVDYMGKDEYKAILNLDGSTVKNTMEIATGSGSYKDGNTSFDIVPANNGEPISLTNANGYLMFANKGKLEALRFLEKVVSNPQYYYAPCISATFTAFDAQSAFVLNGIGDSSEKQIAFLVDGIWWQNEAASDFEYAEKFGTEYSKANRNFGVLSFPKADQSKVGEPLTLFDLSKCVGFIYSGIKPQKVELAKLFLSFCCTDDALNSFTAITGTPKALKYELTDETEEVINGYTKSVWDIYNTCDIIPHYSSNVIYKRELSSVNIFLSFESADGTQLIQSLCPTMAGNAKLSAETVFKHIVEFKHHAESGWKTMMRNYI